jgi:hypothetical protein
MVNKSTISDSEEARQQHKKGGGYVQEYSWAHGLK